MKKIFLYLISINLIVFADMVRSDIGIVTDSLTLLEWQDDYSDNNNLIKRGHWKVAINYCNNLSLDGGGWRLPNKNELLSIKDFNHPNITSEFHYTSPYNYWSSTTASNIKWVSMNDSAWMVSSYSGLSYSGKENFTTYIRCVR